MAKIMADAARELRADGEFADDAPDLNPDDFLVPPVIEVGGELKINLLEVP